MNTDEIKWIVYHGRHSDPVCRSCNERLEKYGFCFVLDEYGSDISKSAQLAVMNVMLEKQLPNILIICPHQLMFSWYREMVTGCGADFKMLTASTGTIEYFSQNLSNLFIVSENSLEHGNQTLAKACDAIAWDLVIVDGTLASGGIGAAIHPSSIKIRADKLLVFSPFPVGTDGDTSALGKIAAALLSDPEKVKVAQDAPIDKACIRFDAESPVARHFDKSVYLGNTSRKTTLLRYTFDPAFLSGLRRIADLSTGALLYRWGGNIFEEYATDITRLYVKSAYTVRDVDELRNVDKKLDCFLTHIDGVMKSEDGRAAVYCVSPNTVSYLTKVLNAVYSKSEGTIKVCRSDIYDTVGITDAYERKDNLAPDRVMITMDDMSAMGDSLKGCTHIYHYELPDDPRILEMRTSRHQDTDAQNVFFFDTNVMFDGRMLSLVLYGRLYESLMIGIPGRNILFDLENAAECTALCVKELMQVISASAVAGSDAQSRLTHLFNIPKDAGITDAEKANEFAKQRLHDLLYALGAESAAERCGNNVSKLEALFKPILDGNKGSLLYIDEGKIASMGGEELSSYYNEERVAEYSARLSESEADVGLKAAKKSLSGFYEEGSNALLRDCVSQLPDALRMPVLLNAWRYLTDEFIIQEGFREFMKNYNEGVM